LEQGLHGDRASAIPCCLISPPFVSRSASMRCGFVINGFQCSNIGHFFNLQRLR
jgi:hypothetical protein